jgi:hypothetical protein
VAGRWADPMVQVMLEDTEVPLGQIAAALGY